MPLPHTEFVRHCLDLLACIGPCHARRMFGGWGIHHEGLTFALIADLGQGMQLWFKVDDRTHEIFTQAGAKPFVYLAKSKPVTLHYLSAPEEAMESPALMAPWAQHAWAAAVRAQAQKASSRLPKLDLTLQFASFHDVQAHRLVLPRSWVMRTLRHALETPGEITVRIVDEPEGQSLNQTYRHKNHPTNVLTFDYEQSPRVLADLVLCGPVVAREAKEQGRTLQAHYTHLLVHGCLHAQGWDHEDSLEQAQAMEAKEVTILDQLGIANPYAQT